MRLTLTSPVFLLQASILAFVFVSETSSGRARTVYSNVTYYEKEDNTPKDRCGYKDPEFPYAITKLSGYRRILTIVHGSIMIWIFIFFIPISIFPVFWHRLSPNDKTENRHRHIKPWMRTHIRFTYLVYPLMICSVVCAMAAKHESHKFLGDSNCSFYNQIHELIGVVCFLVYSFQFFMGFFTYESLLNDIYQRLRICHSISNIYGYVLSVPLLAMARVSAEEGTKRYLYIVPYFYFFFSQVNIHIRMKFADFTALEWHIITEAELAKENKGIMLRTSQWQWNFGLPSKVNESHLMDLHNRHRSRSRIRIEQYVTTYKYYWRRTRLICFVISVLMTVHLGLLYSGIYLSSANYFPNWHCLGDFYANWSLLEIYYL